MGVLLSDILYLMENQTINGVQADILRQLFNNDSLRFAKLNVGQVSSDQFSYHLRQLIKYGLITKTTDNIYSLSPKGRTRTIMLYPNKAGFIEQGFLAVRIILTKTENGQEYFLVQERKQVPYQGTYSTVGDKILFGEDVADAAVRAMKAQTGLDCDMQLLGVKHYKDLYRGEIMQDKYFFVFRATNPVGTLQDSGKGRKNLWLTLEEVRQTGRTIQGGLEILAMAHDSDISFGEVTLTVDSY